MITIAERLQSAYARKDEATKKCTAFTENVTLVAVSKTKAAQLIIEAYRAGQRIFAESYVQEAVEKIAELHTYEDIEWHFIGPIQSNKTKEVAEHFDWVQSVDREKIARRLNDQRPKERGPLNVLVQVNISAEASKSGCALSELNDLCAFVDECPNLTLRGLMAIPAKTTDSHAQLEVFKQLRGEFDTLKTRYVTMDTLSMGMSNDMTEAIMAGSTMVRIGTDIFGARN